MGWMLPCKEYLGKSSYLTLIICDRYNLSRKMCEIQTMHEGSKQEIWAESLDNFNKLEMDNKRWVGCWEREQAMVFMKTTLWGLSLCWQLGCVPVIVNLPILSVSCWGNYSSSLRMLL